MTPWLLNPNLREKEVDNANTHRVRGLASLAPVQVLGKLLGKEVLLIRRFTVSMYLSIEAENEEEARKILDSVESYSPHENAIFWKSLNTQLEEEPDL